MTELLNRASRHFKSMLTSQDSSWDEDLALAAQYDAERGYDLSRRERAKLAYELNEGAPVAAWTPPSRRLPR